MCVCVLMLGSVLLKKLIRSCSDYLLQVKPSLAFCKSRKEAGGVELASSSREPKENYESKYGK